MILEAVTEILASMGATYTLIGGQAVALRGHPRFTLDYDLLTTDRRVFGLDVWRSLEDRGATVNVRLGDFEDPLAGVVHISLDQREADLVVGKLSWEQGVIDRAELLTLEGIVVPVAKTSDLILLKLTAGGFLDLQDVYALLQIGPRAQLISEVEKTIPALAADAREAWRIILSSR